MCLKAKEKEETTNGERKMEGGKDVCVSCDAVLFLVSRWLTESVSGCSLASVRLIRRVGRFYFYLKVNCFIKQDTSGTK